MILNKKKGAGECFVLLTCSFSNTSGCSVDISSDMLMFISISATSLLLFNFSMQNVDVQTVKALFLAMTGVHAEINAV